MIDWNFDQPECAVNDNTTIKPNYWYSCRTLCCDDAVCTRVLFMYWTVECNETGAIDVPAGLPLVQLVG
jgi:hypothetical protein